MADDAMFLYALQFSDAPSTTLAMSGLRSSLFGKILQGCVKDGNSMFQVC